MLKKALLGTALCLALPLAHADTALLRYSNLTVNVADLDTSDAYTPDEASVDAFRTGWLSSLYSNGDVSAGAYSATLENPVGDLTTASFEQPGASGKITLDLVNKVFESSVNVTAPETAYKTNLSPFGDSDAGDFEIAIAPNSSLTISFDTEASAAFSAPCGPGTACGQVTFSPFLLLEVFTATGAFVDSFVDDYTQTVDAGMGLTFSRSETLSLTFENTTSNWLYATPRSDFFFEGQVGAVPEPETWALMLGGLALVGAAARRKKA